MEEGQKRDGKKFKSDGAGVHAGVRVARPKPTAMSKPMENPGDAIAEAVVVIWVVKEAPGQRDNCQSKEGGRQKFPDACPQTS